MSEGIGDPVPAALPAGVHRLRSKEPTSAVAESLERSGWSVRVVDLADAADKAAILDRFVDGLALPAWFGRNWDALSDSLRDLGWWAPGRRGRVIVICGVGRLDTGTDTDRATVREILDEAAASWEATSTPLVILLRREPTAASPAGWYRRRMGLGFGLLSAQLRPGETDWTRAYDDTMRIAVEAERMGFSSIWTTEHHFVDDGYMPSLLVVGAALAQATSTIELGTGVILAPLHHPIRLAEDAATVQLLSHGRLTLGLGLGWAEIEFAGLGADARRRGAAMEEILEILPKAWTGEPFRHQGAVYDLPEVGVRPRPSTRIPVVIGGGAEPAIRRAARLADGIYSNGTAEGFAEQVGWVLDEMAAIGRDPATFRFIHYSMLIPGPSRAEALARYRDAIWAVQWKYSDMVASAARPLPPPPAPAFIRPDEALLKRGATYAGTPAELVDALQALRASVPVPVELATRSHFPLLELDDQLELMRVLAEEVAPHV